MRSNQYHNISTLWPEAQIDLYLIDLYKTIFFYFVSEYILSGHIDLDTNISVMDVSLQF